MSRGLAGFDRFLIFLLSLLLILGGLWAVLWYFDVSIAHRYAEYLDLGIVSRAFSASWWPAALGIFTALSVILGLILLIANLRRNSFNRLTSPHSNSTGDLSLATTRLADAVGDDLEKTPQVEDVKNTTKEDRGRQTLTWRITADPRVSMPTLISAVNQADQDVREAVGDLDVDTRYLVQLNPVS
ncbi:hypothetical protein [Corynebacterium tapiri]|uniref:Alkaline shock response membrane anchor protein AmaP n=1 Tax=Corynebacterium tapiri TaxID=1448266 RepID=A0A5C4U633_9CORY|nr:hypothetical protein [Corynebacterium tapiri]TNL98578.1 hypothetical protein FHE74_05090 [Corynebacterium tapiri]